MCSCNCSQTASDSKAATALAAWNAWNVIIPCPLLACCDEQLHACQAKFPWNDSCGGYCLQAHLTAGCESVVHAGTSGVQPCQKPLPLLSSSSTSMSSKTCEVPVIDVSESIHKLAIKITHHSIHNGLVLVQMVVLAHSTYMCFDLATELCSASTQPAVS